MSLEELRERGRHSRWKEMRNKRASFSNFCLPSLSREEKSAWVDAPEGTLVMADKSPNSYRGWFFDRPDVYVYVVGLDAEYRVISALKSLEERR